jgi:hypothetical protein
MSLTEKLLFSGLVIEAILLMSRGPNSMGGDAPHYLAMSHSLAHDQDLDLTNQYSPEGGYIFYPGPPEGHARAGRGGRLYSIHYTGLPIAATPVFWLAEQIALRVPETFLDFVTWDRALACRDLISVAMALVYAWTATLTYRTTKRLYRMQTLPTLATALAFGVPPLVCMSILVFTEVPAAFLLAWFSSMMLGPRLSVWKLMVPLSLLPWLHARYSLFALIAFVWVALHLWRNEERPMRAMGTVLPIPVVSALLLFVHGWWMFGTVLPFGRYGEVPPLSTHTLLPGLMGLLLDRDFGLLSVAPFWGIALATWIRSRHVPVGYTAFAGSCFLGSWIVGAFHPIWWGGFSPPARFILPILPLLVPLLAQGLSRFQSGWKRGLLCIHLLWSGTMLALLVMRPVRLWADPVTGMGLMAAIPPLHRLWPSFLDPELSTTSLLGVTLILVLLVVPAFGVEGNSASESNHNV